MGRSWVSGVVLLGCTALAIACSGSSPSDPAAGDGDVSPGDGDGDEVLPGDGDGDGDDVVPVDIDGGDPAAPIDLGPTEFDQGHTGEIVGPIGEDTALWGPGDVTLTGPVTVPAGITLTLNPGTHVFGDFPITVEGGAFVCNGSFAEPATIFGSSLVLRGGEHSLRFCTMNSTAPTAIDVDGARVGIEHFQLQRFGTSGILVHGVGAKVSINYSTLGSASTLFTGDDPTKVGVAVQFAADAANSGSRIQNSVLGFLHNATNIGLRIDAPASDLKVSYSMISGTGAMPPLAEATGVYFGFPDVTDIPNLDYHLNFFSPALDLADPVADHSLEPAPNGGRANIGYYGRTPGARITSVALTDPNGCEEFEPGSEISVTWKSSPNTGPKTLSLSLDGGATWETAAAITNDTGKAEVTLPSTQTDEALFRLSQDNFPDEIFDVSNRPFAIGLPADEEQCALEVRCPPGTEGCKPFEVICYTGYREGQMPTGLPSTEPSYEEVLEDMTLMAPYTHGIRTYGSGPQLHNGQYVPTIADNLGLDLHMGIWIDDSYTDEQNMAAIDHALSIVQEGHPSIKTLVVGNEYMLRVRQNFGDSEAAEERLIGYIEYVQEMAPENITVVTGESYPDWLVATQELFEAVDTVVWHVHPWWQQHAIADAAQHVENAHNEVKARMAALGIDKPELLGETGYPWDVCNGPACGTEDNQARYLKELHEYSLQSGLEYWFFSGFDEPWKDAEGPVGDNWGMWSMDRMPHPVISEVETLITPEGLWAP